VFDYGQKAAADQMRTTWDKLVQHVGTSHGQDISDELQNKKTVTSQPAHTADVLSRHATQERMIRTAQQNIHRARIVQRVALLAAVAAGEAEDAPSMKLAIVENEIAQGKFEASVKIPIDLNDSEKTQHVNDWRSCQERDANPLKHRGQEFSLIFGQCTQLPQDKMKQDTDWTAVSTSYDPLTLFRLIKKTALAQTEDQHPFASVHDQELGLHSFRQETLSNAQWHERFNAKVDVGEAIGVTRLHTVLVEHVSQELQSQDFASLGAAEQQVVRDDDEERCILHAFPRQSGTQHGDLNWRQPSPQDLPTDTASPRQTF
jgi:hypothetical protein